MTGFGFFQWYDRRTDTYRRLLSSISERVKSRGPHCYGETGKIIKCHAKSGLPMVMYRSVFRTD